MKYLLFCLTLLSLSVQAFEDDKLKFEFGRVIFNELQEAIGFEHTEKIPVVLKGANVMYGLLVTSETDEILTLDSVHTIPTKDNKVIKVIGKSINMKHKAAIFLKTENKDVVGDYKMEVFIDGRLIKTFDYQLVSST
ncbi:hypothetical protein [Thalassotalea marina]|uniref:DUF4426 domain-containing protein n=1 Tax=Thalassotalea marina TaxID=1673741 RepID=A0A919ENW7_9GAMM|nr:hypothetical protein [Thalassotalea marina]GHG03411.1 hypothetical protein GCM10017161_35860 [Thalassotalea marina]